MFPLIAMGIVIDQLVKLLVISTFSVGEWITPVPGVHITLALNTGVAFGLFSTSQGIGYYLLNTLIIIFNAILVENLSASNKACLVYRYGIACIIIGGFSNLIDRFIYGAVIDYLTFGAAWLRWPTIFNLADVLICTGCLMLLISNQTLSHKFSKQAPQSA